MAKPFRSVRSRIILIITILLILFLIIYTLTAWMIINSYALINTSQNNSFSLSLVVNDISNRLSDVRALVTRVSIDNELKSYLAYGYSLGSYYDRFTSTIQSNPSYSYIDRFIVSNSLFTEFLQTGGANVSTGRPLRQDYFLQEISHIDRESGNSGLFYSELAYLNYQVIAYLMPIINYNNGLTLGYVYASVNVDTLLRNLYTYQTLNDAELYITIEGNDFKIENNGITVVEKLADVEDLRTVFSNETTVVYKDGKNYIMQIEDRENALTVSFVFTSHLIGVSSKVPLLILAIMIGSVVLITALILSLYLNKAIYQPVKKLAKRISRIQKSDFSQDDGINTDDEFGIIGRGINKLSSEVTNLMDKRVEDERKKIELEYRMLSSQINPHFLYNTFNSIKWMATIQKADGIGEMVTALSRLMKNISKRDEAEVRLEEELSFIDSYLVIMKYRYGNSISYYEDIDLGCRNLVIPRFTLQPLVENAIFHGVEPKGTGAVAIIAKEFPDHYIIMVADNGVGFNIEENKVKTDGVFKNIGLDNIKQRLKYSFGDDVSFEIKSTIGLYTLCKITIKKRSERGL